MISGVSKNFEKIPDFMKKNWKKNLGVLKKIEKILGFMKKIGKKCDSTKKKIGDEYISKKCKS